MSFKALSYVWAHSQAKGATFVVHLALADYANEEDKAWPSVESLSAKCRLSTRAVLYAIQELADDLKAVSVEKYASRRRTHLYTMNYVHSESGSQCTTFVSTVNDVPIHSAPRSPNPIGTTKNHNTSPSLRSGASASQSQVRREEPISEEEKRPISLSPSRTRPALQEIEGFPVERVVKGWNRIPGIVPFNGEIPPSFRRRILQRINEQPNAEWWWKQFETLTRNDWVCGRTDSAFRVTLSWLLGPKGWDKLRSGELDAGPKAERKVSI